MEKQLNTDIKKYKMKFFDNITAQFIAQKKEVDLL